MPVTFKGPVFDGTAEWMLTQGIEDGRQEVAEQMFRAVHANTGRFRNPTGRYQGLLAIRPMGAFLTKIEPGMLPYVRWLEGTSRRNDTTRFKGYRVFRAAFELFDGRGGGRAVQIVEQRLRPVLAAING